MTALADAVPALLVVLAIPLVAWGWSRRGRSQPHRRLRITDKAGLAKGSMLAVVEVDGRRLLIGAAERGVTLISELEVVPATETELFRTHEARPGPPHPAPYNLGRGHLGSGHLGSGRRTGSLPTHGLFAPRTNGLDERPRIGLLRRMQLMTLRSPEPPPILDPFDAPPH